MKKWVSFIALMGTASLLGGVRRARYSVQQEGLSGKKGLRCFKKKVQKSNDFWTRFVVCFLKCRQNRYR
jgi:hypothetical protein